MQKRSPELHLLIRLTALFLCLSLPFSDPRVYADPGPGDSAIFVPPAASQGKTALNLPETLGTVEEFHPGRSGKIIFYLQDAHDSLEAQENIAKILNFLMETQGIKTVFEEGYEGLVPSDDYFGGIQDSALREKVSYYLMDKLRLGGAEYAHINRKKNFDLIGADSIALHFENIRAFQQSVSQKEETQRDLAVLSSEVRKLADRTFPNELKEWMKLKKRLDEGEIELLDYVKRVFDLGHSGDKSEDAGEYPMLKMLLALKEEKPETPGVETIDAKGVYTEIQKLEKNTAGRFLKGEDSLRIFSYTQNIELLRRLSEMKVSSAEYEALQGTLKDFDTRHLAKFLVRESGQSLVLSRQWEKNIRKAVRFYTLAQARDKKIEKVLKYAPAASALVFGGFHKDSIKAMLQRSGDACYVISPRMTGVSRKHQDYYQQLMRQGYRNLSLPEAAARASVAPRAMEFPVLHPEQSANLRGLITRVETAAKQVKAGDSAEVLAEMDLLLSSRPELRSDDFAEVDPLQQEDEIYGRFSELFSELVNSLAGNRLSIERVRKMGYVQILQTIQERLDFVRQLAGDRDYGTLSRTLKSIESEIPADILFDPARENIASIQAYLVEIRSELRAEYSSAPEKLSEPPISAVEIHALRLARERKVVGLPYFANFHQVSFTVASRALEKAGFESYGPSEVGEQFVYPLTTGLERSLLKENPETGEEEARTSEILKIGEALTNIRDSIAKYDFDPEWVKRTKLSSITSEKEPSGSPARKLFYFRENTEHGLNNLLTILLFSPRSVTYSMLRDVADDLWVSTKVLEDLTNRPLNDYSEVGEGVKPLIYGHNAANRIGSGAVNSAAAKQFTARHYEEIGEIRKQLEQVYGRVLRVMNSREREFMQRSELRTAGDGEEWEDPAGVVTVEKDQGFFAKLGRNDREVLMKLLSGSREDVRRMAGESSGRIYFKNEDGDFSEEGRSVYLRLETPVEVSPKSGSQEKVQITQLRLKGVKPILTEAGGVQPYTGQGSVRRYLVPDRGGVLNAVPAETALAGGMREKDARTEFSVMMRARETLQFRTDYAVAWGTFPGMTFQENSAGFVIAGLTGDDWRVTSVGQREGSGVTLAVAPVQARSGGEMDEGSEEVLYQAIGRALRNYHEAGFYHGFPHPANMGIEVLRGRFEIIFRDLNTTKMKTPEMTPEEERAYRFLDLADVIVRLTNLGKENLSEVFLKSYFHDLNQSSERFLAMTASARGTAFLVKLLRLEDTLPQTFTRDDGQVFHPRAEYPTLESLRVDNQDPEFGALWEALGEVIRNRSELRTAGNPDASVPGELIRFLHDEVFLHRYGYYEILADHSYADMEDIDRETLRLLQEKAPLAAPGPFRVVLLNAYTAASPAGNKNSHLVILSNDPDHPVAMGFVTLQDAETFLEGLGDGPFRKGESKDQSYFVTRTDVFPAYQGQALMQRAVTALLLKGDVRKWIPSPTQLYPSRKMYERMQEDKRLLLEGRPRVKMVTARSELRTTANALAQQGVQNVERSELRAAEPASPHVVEVYDLQKNDVRILFNETASGHFRFDHVNRKSYWDGELFERAMGGEENDPLGRRVNKPWEELEAELGPLGYREADIYSYHNLYYVDWFVLYDGASKRLYHREGEPLNQRNYSMFVNWKDKSRAPSSEELSFEEGAGENGAVKVYRTSDLTKTDIASEIQQAFFGQRVLHEGQAEPFENIAHQFEDIFQVYLFPQFIETHRDDKGQVDSYVYKESLAQQELVRLRDENRESFKEVIRQDGRMTIDLSPYLQAHTQEELERDALENPFRKYVKVTPRPLEQLASGEYFIEGGKLSIHLKRYPYPHDLVGITREGKAVAFVIIGDKFEGKGTAAQELGAEVQRLYSEKMKALGKSAEEDPLREVFLLANSRDAMQRKWKDGVSSVSAASARPYPSSTGALVFAKIETAAAPERKIGTQEELVRQISANWDAIRERGFFMFDMQKTLAARRKPAAEGMIQLLAWMLEEKVRLVINSGNPMKDVMDQVLNPLKDYLTAQGKLELLSGISFSVYSASGTVFVTFDEKGNAVEHSDYEAKLRISRPVVEQTIHDVLVEFGKKKFGLDAEGIETLRAAYIKDASKNPGLIYELPWAENPEAYQPGRVHFDDLGNKAMTVQGPYIQLRGSQVTDTETTSITITKLPPEIRPAIIDRLKELLAQRLGEDFVNHLSLSVGGESSIDIFSADANKAKALMHYAEEAVKNSERPEIDLGFGYYFGDELTGNVHGSTMTEKIHKGNDMIVADYPFPGDKYRRIQLVSLSPEPPEGIPARDFGRTYWGGVEQKGTEELFAKVKERVESARISADSRSELRVQEEGLTSGEAPRDAGNPLVSSWNRSSSEEKHQMLEIDAVAKKLKSGDLTDWLMSVLLDADFVNRRRVVELNNWDPGLMIAPEILLEHLSRPWESLEKYGPPAMPQGQEFNEVQAFRNKRMALLILLVERVAEELTHRLDQASEETRDYVKRISEVLSAQIKPEAQDWLENFDAKYEALKIYHNRNPQFALGEKRYMSFLDVFLLESFRYASKSMDQRSRDHFGWFHDDYALSFLYALKVPELNTLLDRIAERMAEENRGQEKDAASSEGVRSRSELRLLGAGGGIRESLEKTAQLPARVFISYEEIRSQESPLYESVFALGFQTRSDKNTKVIIYGVDPEALMTPRMQQLRDAAGILTIEGDLQRAYQLYGKGFERGTAGDRNPRLVHFALHAERLKEQASDEVIRFLAAESRDLFAALLLARSGGQMPGVYQDPESGFYSVVEGFLKTELARYQASLVIEMAA